MLERVRITAHALNITRFKGRNGYIQSFLRYNKVQKFARLYSEDNAILPDCHAQRMAEIRGISALYRLKNIYNVDESSPFYRKDRKRPYLAPGETAETVRGTDSQKHKAYITMSFTLNGDGSHEIAVWYIGHVAQMRCFYN